MPYSDPAKQRECQRVWRNKRRAEYVDRRGSKCQHCGSISRLEFHHRDPEEKISHKVFSWTRPRLEAELGKV